MADPFYKGVKFILLRHLATMASTRTRGGTSLMAMVEVTREQ